MAKNYVLVFDVDNTLYDFIDFFGPAFRSMMHAVASGSGIDEDLLMESAKSVYGRAGTLEHQFLIQNMSIFSNLAVEEHRRLIGLARQAFSRTRNKRLKPYEGIADVLSVAEDAGCRIVCLTNAPYYHVYKRIIDLKLLRYMDGLVAWEGSEIEGDILQYKDKYERAKLRLSERDSFFFEIVSAVERKPSDVPFRRIQDRFGPNYTYVAIGDSPAKDLAPASSCGMITLYARYGTKVDRRNLETVLKVTPWMPSEISMSSRADFRPDFVIDRPTEIIDVLQLVPRQGKLFR